MFLPSNAANHNFGGEKSIDGKRQTKTVESKSVASQVSRIGVERVAVKQEKK
jgi:hypothetical protein